ncbi:hypothetical protein D9757_008483 [Collybiopsis confluens]|uniref:Uncharacterized protein n=1 Tax=Collybiopsis confluens TaxID=2823264 RepID=A0A8H5HG14_9AGAR|nr:hypothetical protein D9757_008483 [Collybiopsis confluens]
MSTRTQTDTGTTTQFLRRDTNGFCWEDGARTRRCLTLIRAVERKSVTARYKCHSFCHIITDILFKSSISVQLIGEEILKEYFDEMGDHYTADKYRRVWFKDGYPHPAIDSLFQFPTAIHSFTDEFAALLTGGSIPDYIKDLPLQTFVPLPSAPLSDLQYMSYIDATSPPLPILAATPSPELAKSPNPSLPKQHNHNLLQAHRFQ